MSRKLKRQRRMTYKGDVSNTYGITCAGTVPVSHKVEYKKIVMRLIIKVINNYKYENVINSYEYEKNQSNP